MDKPGSKPLECPVHVDQCDWLDELAGLREEVVQLTELVSIDALTGLYNYRHFSIVLQAEMDRCKRSGIQTSLVVVDLDHFKAVNDKYGHETGNLVLKHAAGILNREVRSTDIVCRYGGEEFAIIFPETQLNIAVQVADRIREELANSPILVDDTSIRVTASMGASAYLKTSLLDFSEFVESVDRYLYQAKSAGRNQICHMDYSALRPETEVLPEERALLFKKD